MTLLFQSFIFALAYINGHGKNSGFHFKLSWIELTVLNKYFYRNPLLKEQNSIEVVYLILLWHFRFWHFQEWHFQKVSLSDILRNDYLDHFDTFGENFEFDTFKNDTFESVWVDRHPQWIKYVSAVTPFLLICSLDLLNQERTALRAFINSFLHTWWCRLW